MKFHCKTTFDITVTGITGHFKSSRVPFNDHSGQAITDAATWARARNQQRNWETLTQILSLRTQLNELSIPVRKENCWEFTFEVDSPSVFGTDADPVAILCADAEGVPMIVSKNNEPDTMDTLSVSKNIWFTPWKGATYEQ